MDNIFIESPDTIEVLDIDEVFLNNLRVRMDEMGWEVPELAKASSISSSYLYNVMKRERWPSPPYLQRIATAVGRSVSSLFSEAKPEPKSLALLRVIELYSSIPRLNDSQVSTLLISVRTFLKDGAEPHAIKKDKNSR